MRKTAIFLLACVMVLGLLAGCGQTTSEHGWFDKEDKPVPPVATEPPVILPEDALDMLQTVWDGFAPQERFDVIGGNGSAVTGNPGSIVISESTVDLETMFWIPDSQLQQVWQAASMMHGLNRNLFTCVGVQLQEGADTAIFANSWKQNVQNARWVCGAPERILAITLGDNYVVCVFGNAKNVITFERKMTAAYPTAQILCSEVIG